MPGASAASSGYGASPGVLRLTGCCFWVLWHCFLACLAAACLRQNLPPAGYRANRGKHGLFANLDCTYHKQWSCKGVASAGGVCCLRRRGEWWSRLSLDLEHLGRPDESLEVVSLPLPHSRCPNMLHWHLIMQGCTVSVHAKFGVVSASCSHYQVDCKI